MGMYDCVIEILFEEHNQSGVCNQINNHPDQTCKATVRNHGNGCQFIDVSRSAEHVIAFK